MRVAASVKQPSRSRAPSAGAAALHPLPGDLCKTPPPPRKRGGSSPSPRGEAESGRPRPEFGEGSSAHPPQLVEAASSSLSLEGEGWGEGGCFGQAAKPKSRTIPPGPPIFTLSLETLAKPRLDLKGGAPIFTLSKGRGRIGRPRPNSVRGLPRTHPRVTQTSSVAEGRS